MKATSFGQVRCEHCNSWHFGVYYNEVGDITEYKCCRCFRIFKAMKNIYLQKVVDER